MNKILKAKGFKEGVKWSLGGNIDFNIVENKDVESKNDVLYAHCSNNEIMYFGLTRNTFKKRMGQYRKPGPSQTTNINVNNEIINELKKNKNVQTYYRTWNPKEEEQLNGMDVPLEAIESTLIYNINPPWNRKN